MNCDAPPVAVVTTLSPMLEDLTETLSHARTKHRRLASRARVRSYCLCVSHAANEGVHGSVNQSLDDQHGHPEERRGARNSGYRTSTMRVARGGLIIT